MAKVNDNLIQGSTSTLVNSAAKDECISTSLTNSYNVSQLLANDPGSARFVGFVGANGLPGIGDAGVHLGLNGAFTVDPGITSFEYTIRLANGTYSTAIAHLAGAGSLLFLDNFGSYTTDNSFGIVDLGVGGWTGGANAEVVKDGYLGILTGPDADAYWLDTQGSPGGLDITHAVTDANGGQAQITLSVAVQQFDTWLSSGDLQILWNNVLVQTITTASLGDVNNFHTISFVVDSLVGANTLGIKDTGVSYVGFALDNVSVVEWFPWC